MERKERKRVKGSTSVDSRIGWLTRSLCFQRRERRKKEEGGRKEEGYKKRELGVPTGELEGGRKGNSTGGGVREGGSKDGTGTISENYVSPISGWKHRDEDERTRYEITGIKGRVKSHARTGHRRNRNITIGINSVPRSSFLAPLSWCVLSASHLVLLSFGTSFVSWRLIVDLR